MIKKLKSIWCKWSLATKLMLIMSALIIVAVDTVTLLAIQREQKSFRVGLEQQADLLLNTLEAATVDLLYNLDTNGLSDIMEALGKDQQILLSGQIYDSKGRVIADAYSQDISLTLELNQLGQKLVKSDTTYFEWQDNQLLAGRAVTVGPQRLGAISVGLPTKILNDKIKTALIQSVVADFIAVIVSLLIARMMGKSITRPLKKLVKATKRIADGDLSHTIAISSGDEVATLGNSMERMREKLQGLYIGLEKSEKKYRAVFEDSKDVIFISSPAGKIIDINPAVFNLFGYTREEAIKLDTQSLLYANPAEQVRFWQEIEPTNSIIDFEFKARKKDGTEIDCLMTATLQKAENGSVLNYQGIIRDITEQKRIEQERLRLATIEQELSFANEIQQGMLPPPNPGWDGLDVVCYSASAREVGGDFYSYHMFNQEMIGREHRSKKLSLEYPLPAYKYALALGDVVGKGVSAAMMMAISLSQFDATLALNFTPAERLIHLDKVILPYTGPRHQNCALCYIELEIGKNGNDSRLRFINAGSIPPYIKRQTGEVEWFEIGGFALGLGLGAEFGYQEMTINVSKGDLIILTSDGVVEANNASNEIFGFDRLMQIVVNAPTNSAMAMMDYLKTEIAEFVDGTEQHDDMTIVVVKL